LTEQYKWVLQNFRVKDNRKQYNAFDFPNYAVVSFSEKELMHKLTVYRRAFIRSGQWKWVPITFFSLLCLSIIIYGLKEEESAA